MTYNATLTAICEIIEDARDNGLLSFEVSNLIENIPAELEGRAEQRMAATFANFDRMMKEAAR
jgi:hypothetical protein